MDPSHLAPSKFPFAEARLACTPPCTPAELKLKLATFKGASVASCYRGPAWTGPDGIACVVVICRDRASVERLRDCRFGFITWLWNISPSMYFSLTLTCTQMKEPYARWFAPAASSVVQSMRQHGRLRVTVATPNSVFCGWHEALFFDGVPGKGSSPSTRALEELFTFERPGIPHSDRHVPYHYAHRNPELESANEIELWAEPAADFWHTLAQEGPWSADLSHEDQARASWGYLAWRTRHLAAGVIETIRQEQAAKTRVAIFTEEGLPAFSEESSQQLSSRVRAHPLIGTWLAALCGPNLSAQRAHGAAVALLDDPKALFEAISFVFRLLTELDNEHLHNAMRMSLEAALLDSSITLEGTARPWLANTVGFELALKRLPVDLTVSAQKIHRLWSAGLEMVDLIDSGLWLTARDFPVATEEVSKAMESVVLEGSVEHAEERTLTLLAEAKQARQWTIPWGARIQLSFGPFVALRIFEREGEFTCHFLDAEDQYFTVAIGIYKDTPTLATHYLFRSRSDDGELMVNEDALAVLKLLAAAVIRDFLVVEERERVFGARALSGQRRARTGTSVIYLPRVRYTTPSHDRLMALPGEATARIRHQVTHHLRRVREASAAQRFLAQSYGIPLPEGFTFVRAHERGTHEFEEQIRIYRSRSASRMLFQEVDVAPAGSRPAWFEFEKDCARVLRRRGLKVIHRAAHRDPDGGCDLYAVDEKGQAWVVQCKCWASHREITPAVVRELIGAMTLAAVGSTAPCQGVLITTSRFSSGALALAHERNIQTLDGTQLAGLLAELA